MGRPSKFDSEQMLDAAAGLVARGGPSRATVAAIAEKLEAPSGSIYHRFESRDLLLARLWIRTVRRAQEGFAAALDGPDLAEAGGKNPEALDSALADVYKVVESLLG